MTASTSGSRTRSPAGCGRYAGEQVALGIRPEDLHLATAADPPELGFDAVVEVVEKLGSEILLDVAVDGETMVASVEPTVRVGDSRKAAAGDEPGADALFRHVVRRW